MEELRANDLRPASTDHGGRLGWLAVACVLVSVAGFACRTRRQPTSPTPPAAAPSPAAAAPAAETRTPDEGEPSEVAEAEPAADEPASYAPDTDGWGDECRDDDGCAWDDPCMAERCVGAEHAPTDVACAESRPPPGTCSCVARRCTLRPAAVPEPPAEACGAERCGLDQGAGRCLVGTALRANERTLLEGPMCRCDPAQQCVFEWVERVPCRRDRDCWFEVSPRLHPIRRPPRVRGRFQPCVDGEQEPVCESGFCAFSHSVYRC